MQISRADQTEVHDADRLGLAAESRHHHDGVGVDLPTVAMHSMSQVTADSADGTVRKKNMYIFPIGIQSPC